MNNNCVECTNNSHCGTNQECSTNNRCVDEGNLCNPSEIYCFVDGPGSAGTVSAATCSGTGNSYINERNCPHGCTAGVGCNPPPSQKIFCNNNLDDDGDGDIDCTDSECTNHSSCNPLSC